MKKTLLTLAATCLFSLSLASCNEQSGFDASQNIVPFTRDTESGTREGFMEKIGLSAASKDNSALKASVQEVTSNGDMVQKISSNEYGIGYISLTTQSLKPKNPALKFSLTTVLKRPKKTFSLVIMNSRETSTTASLTKLMPPRNSSSMPL